MGFNLGSPLSSMGNEEKSTSSDINITRPLNKSKSFWGHTCFAFQGPLKPFRLLREDLHHLTRRYTSDWRLFNQLIFASAVYVFFTNLLPGITFASDLYTLTGQNYGTIEVVFSTGLCGVIFSL